MTLRRACAILLSFSCAYSPLKFCLPDSQTSLLDSKTSLCNLAFVSCAFSLQKLFLPREQTLSCLLDSQTSLCNLGLVSCAYSLCRSPIKRVISSTISHFSVFISSSERLGLPFIMASISSVLIVSTALVAFSMSLFWA